MITHVTTAWGGGVRTAIEEYISSTPYWSHRVLAMGNGQDNEMITYSQNQADFVGKLRNIYKQEIGPRHVVHLHSSIAGGLGRLMLPISSQQRRSLRVVYSPHGYSFLREDVSRLTATAFRLIETVLARRIDGVGAVGQDERSCALSMGVRNVTLIPHAARYRLGQIARNELTQPKTSRLTVVGVGRLRPQKDPVQFAKIAAGLPDVDFVWVGSGDETMAAELRNARVRVTGWLPPDLVKAELRQSSVVLVTSRWEGFPYSIVEALHEGRPVVYRSIPSLDSEFGAIGYRHLGEAKSLISQLSDHGRWTELLRRQLDAIAVPGRQADALSSLYGLDEVRAGS